MDDVLCYFNRSGTPTMSNDETIHGLKTELERCLHMYKKKTDQIASLQEQLKTIKISLDAHLTRTTQAEQEAIENKVIFMWNRKLVRAR